MTSYSIDHFVLTVHNLDRTCRFYEQVLHIPVVTFGAGRKALQLGNQKINLHELESPFSPHAQRPTSGSADFCLMVDTPVDVLMNHLTEQAVPVLEGPVERTGAQGRLLSIYIRDPDGNLIELANDLSASEVSPGT
ncbi:VOC family protein [Oscillatoria sp. CS-180]|uniref:VOC family protein n=1 Tax=Oscillatoria sp. CS-180 TaxID=3021720 RepID=UPI002330BDEA|nr:VOC family protein [Oscillatoria sp. CS-180]MDB9527748.1 VOC family protein [Oscillatoria sp. CS-180]